MSDPDSTTGTGGTARQHRILEDLQDAVERMHVLSRSPQVVVASGRRDQGARPMAWQVLFERSLGAKHPPLHYRGVSAIRLQAVLANGYDSDPTLGVVWSGPRLGDAMSGGPVIQVFRADRLPDDVSRALLGVIVFEEDGLSLVGVRALVQELGFT
ncbi:MAG: hypothetical protein ACOVSI_00600 [Gemmatimonas sp.]|jgi:hypothetical protein